MQPISARNLSRRFSFTIALAWGDIDPTASDNRPSAYYWAFFEIVFEMPFACCRHYPIHN